jgi:hypothetical protein
MATFQNQTLERNTLSNKIREKESDTAQEITIIPTRHRDLLNDLVVPVISLPCPFPHQSILFWAASGLDAVGSRSGHV